MPPRAGDQTSLLIPAATLLAVAIGGAAIYHEKSRQMELKRAKHKRGIFKKTLQVSKQYSHHDMINQFPSSEAEVESLFQRDLPRLEGLSKEKVFELISTLESAAKHLEFTTNVQRLVFGSCTQSVLAQVLTFLMDEEKKFLKKKAREETILGGVFGQKSPSQTLLLHSILRTSIEPDFKIKYKLMWNIVRAKDPEMLEGRWNADFLISFVIVPGNIEVTGYLAATREDYI